MESLNFHFPLDKPKLGTGASDNWYEVRPDADTKASRVVSESELWDPYDLFVETTQTEPLTPTDEIVDEWDSTYDYI